VPAYYQSTQSQFVKAPPQKVYEALTDWAQRSQWRKGIALEWDGDSTAFLNQKVVFKVQGLFPHAFSFRVAGLEPPRRFYMEYTGPLKGRASLEIIPQEGGSLALFHWMKVEPAGFWPRLYFALGLGMRAHRARTLETLGMLKQHLEAKVPPRKDPQ